MEDRILEYLSAAEAAIEQYGEGAVEFALSIARIDAFSHVAGGFLALAFAWAFIFPVKNLLIRQSEKIQDRIDREFARNISLLLVYILAFGAFVASLVEVLNVFAWIGIFKPEVWLAYKALNGIGG